MARAGREAQRLPLAATLAALPPEWPEHLLPAIRARRRASGQALVVVDDDPTGTQTVHDVPVLTEWSTGALRAELAGLSPDGTFYLLSNSRSLPAEAACALNAEIGRNLALAARQAGRRLAVISRSDSTLRGHFPAETDALTEALGSGPDATLLIPAFVAGGRYTIGDVHYVAESDELVPAGQTEFARDAAFGYASSNLRAWVAEKSGGLMAAEEVASITLEEVRRGGPVALVDRLLGLRRGAVAVVNAASERDLEVVALAALQAEAAGRRFLYRTAASFVRVRAGLSARPLLQAEALDLPAGGGLIVAGSYVPKSTAQIHALRATRLVSHEVDVRALLADNERAEAIERAARAADESLAAGEDTLIVTSRELVTGTEAVASLDIGCRISAALVEMVKRVATRPRYMLAKGGITASDLATQALGVRRAWVLGQVYPGVPVWHLGTESRWPGLAYIVFPGNVGDARTLADMVAFLALR
jgi:uncharacterized protein YgbK (DUF1537 family)